MRRAIVTGSSRGIGAEIVKTLRRDGYDVISVARTDSDFILDMLQDNAIETLKDINSVDIVINNLGGTMSITDPFCNQHDVDLVMRMNFGVAVELNNVFIPRMKAQGWGRIVNVCSTSSLENNGPWTYCAAKAALAAYTRSMGRILAPTGIVMSGLIVGAIKTKGGHFEQATEDHVEKYIRERLPLGKFGEERSIADFVSFLCSDKADFFHGALIPIDGGQSRHFFGGV